MVHAYVLTLQDLKNAQRLHRRTHRRAMARYVFWMYVMPCVSAVCLALLLRDMLFHGFSFPAWLAGVLSALTFLGAYTPILYPFQMRRALRKLFPDAGSMDHPVEIELADGKLISRIPGQSEGHWQRAAVVGYAEDTNICLVYVRKAVFLMIPRHALPGGVWPELQSWLGGTAAC